MSEMVAPGNGILRNCLIDSHKQLELRSSKLSKVKLITLIV